MSEPVTWAIEQAKKALEVARRRYDNKVYSNYYVSQTTEVALALMALQEKCAVKCEEIASAQQLSCKQSAMTECAVAIRSMEEIKKESNG